MMQFCLLTSMLFLVGLTNITTPPLPPSGLLNAYDSSAITPPDSTVPPLPPAATTASLAGTMYTSGTSLPVQAPTVADRPAGSPQQTPSSTAFLLQPLPVTEATVTPGLASTRPPSATTRMIVVTDYTIAHPSPTSLPTSQVPPKATSLTYASPLSAASPLAVSTCLSAPPCQLIFAQLSTCYAAAGSFPPTKPPTISADTTFGICFCGPPLHPANFTACQSCLFAAGVSDTLALAQQGRVLQYCGVGNASAAQFIADVEVLWLAAMLPTGAALPAPLTGEIASFTTWATARTGTVVWTLSTTTQLDVSAFITYAPGVRTTEGEVAASAASARGGGTAAPLQPDGQAHQTCGRGPCSGAARLRRGLRVVAVGVGMGYEVLVLL